MDYYSDDDNIVPYVPRDEIHDMISDKRKLSYVHENKYPFRAYYMDDSDIRHYYGFTNIGDFIETMKKSGNNRWHEVISNKGEKFQKFVIDIDCDAGEIKEMPFTFDEFMEFVLSEMNILFHSAGIITETLTIELNSNRETKFSKHVICKNVNVRGEHAKCFGKMISGLVIYDLTHEYELTEEMIAKITKWIDLSIYDKNHSLRTHLSEKKDAPAFRKTDTKDDIFDPTTLVSICEKDSIYLECLETICIIRQKQERAQQNKHITVADNMKDIADILDNISPRRFNDYNSWCKIGMALYNTSGGTLDGLKIWNECSRKRNPAKYNEGECEAKYQTFKSGDNMITVGTLIAWAREDCPDKLIEYKQNQIQTVNRTKLTAFQYYDSQIKNAKNIRRLVINSPIPNKITRDRYIKINLMEKALWAIYSGMDTGKSTLVLNYVREQLVINPDFKCVLLQFRRSLSDNVVEKTKDMNFTDYRNVTTKLNVDWYNKIIVQVESLHRLIYTNIDLVVIDEVESVDAQIFAGLNEKYNDIIQLTFKDMIKTAKQVIIMDGLLRDKTVKAYETLLGEKFYVHVNEPIIERKKCEVMVVECQWKDSIVSDLCLDRKIYVVSPKGKNFIEKLSKYIEIECEKKNKTIRILTIYGGKDNSKVTENFSTELIKYDLVIASPAVSAGVDFNIEGYFYKVYSYVTSRKVGADSQLQSLKRIRKPICKDICMFVQNCSREPLPLTPESIISAAESKMWHTSVEGVKWPVHTRFERQGQGNIVFENKEDPWFKFFLLVQSSINVQKFDVFQCMVNFLEKEGYELNIVNEIKILEQAKITREISKLIVSKNNKEIANAAEISVMTAYDLKSNKNINPEDKAKLDKFNMRHYYGWEGKIDEAFVKKYRDTKIINMFYMMKSREIPLEQLAFEAEERMKGMTDVSKAKSKENIDRHHAIRDMLNFIGSLKNDDGIISHNSESKEGGLDMLREYINTAIKIKHSAYKGKKIQEDNTRTCQIVNGFISDYGCKIKLIDKSKSNSKIRNYKIINVFEKYFTIDINNKSLPYVQTK